MWLHLEHVSVWWWRGLRVRSGGESTGSFILTPPYSELFHCYLSYRMDFRKKKWIWKEDSTAKKRIWKHHWEETIPLGLSGQGFGGRGWVAEGGAVVFTWRQGGRPAKNRSAHFLIPGVNLEEPGSTCLSQLLWEVLFGSRNLEQQPRAASERNRLFSENRTFGIFKGSILPASHVMHSLWKGARLQRCSGLNGGFRDI